MWRFLLLVLSLMTGCEASSEDKNFTGGWVEFTCKSPETNGKYQIKAVHPKGTVREEDVCLKPINQTAYTTAKTTITCHDNKSRVRFFCKEKGDICEEISSTRSNGRFTLTATNSSFNMSISNVSSEDAGVYWCGLKPKDGNQQTALRRIRLEVKKIPNFTRSPMVGETLTYWCDYSSHTAYTYKFICKGEDPSVCERLVSTQAHKMNNGKFSLNDDRLKRNITITVRDVTADDAGTYWCGAKRSNNESSNPFFHRFIMTVEGSSSHGVTIAVTCVAVLVLVVVVVLIVYKRFKASKERNKNTRNEEAENKNEDYGYSEIQDCLQRPDSGTAPKTVYVTANVPTNHSAFTPHSEVQNSSDEVSGDTYYNMWDSDQCPIYSTVNKASTCPEDPLYSTVDNPQQH